MVREVQGHKIICELMFSEIEGSY